VILKFVVRYRGSVKVRKVRVRVSVTVQAIGVG